MAVVIKVQVIASLLAISLLLVLVVEADQVQSTDAQTPLSPTIDCDAACAVRCGKTKRPNLCKRSCGSCCSRCQCVPPGTAGNYEACPCYAAITTHDNRRKCP